MDTIIIFQGVLYVFEVKNYEGDFYYESDRLYKTPMKEVKDPILQLK
ncbi:NERD domain-containing protein [Bacillus sp. BRMEA1]|nr:NERD domain-containing protein [Neobacillus endophyticus]